MMWMFNFLFQQRVAELEQNVVIVLEHIGRVSLLGFKELTYSKEAISRVNLS